jgi:hypothetical protein
MQLNKKGEKQHNNTYLHGASGHGASVRAGFELSIKFTIATTYQKAPRLTVWKQDSWNFVYFQQPPTMNL